MGAASDAIKTQQLTGAALHSLGSQEIVLVGWSSRAGRMCAFIYSGSGSTVEARPIEEPGYMMPWEDHWGEPPEADDRRGMLDLALAQTRHVKQESRETAMGGRLMLAELTRNGASFSSLGDLSGEQPTGITLSAVDLAALDAGTADAELLAKVEQVKTMSLLQKL